MELISEHNLDLVIATETWLTDSEDDKIWLEGTCLNKDQLRMLVNNSQMERRQHCTYL